MTKDLVSAIQRIEAERRIACAEMIGKQREVEILEATVIAYDRALAELNKATPEDALPVKVPRLDIAKAVVAKLEAGALTLDQLVETLGRKPSQITAAIGRLGSEVYLADDGRYFRQHGVAQAEAAQ